MKLLVKSEFFEVEVEGATAQEVWQRAAFWHSLPTVCPVDGSPVRFGYSNRGGYDFYFLESTGERRYEFQFGQSLEDKSLFPGKVRKVGNEKVTVQEWTYWDADKQVVVAVWRDGQLLASPTPSQQAGQPEQYSVTSEAELDAALDRLLPVEREPDPWEIAYQVFDALGQSAYGNSWWAVACRNAKRISDNQIDNPRKLSLEQIKKLTDGLRKAMQQGQHVAA